MGFAVCVQRDYLLTSFRDDCIESPKGQLLTGDNHDLPLIHTHPVRFMRL